MKQRLALIRAVLHEPQVIFLDEPTSGLDPAGAREVRTLIAGFRAEGRTILLCTHNLAEAEELADVIGVMRRRMLVFGPRSSLASGATRLEIDLAGDGSSLVEALSALPMVVSSRAERSDRSTIHLTLRDLERDTPPVIREVVRLGGEVLAVRPVATSLEEIYLRALDEGAA
jgi:ABC-2 type transport system ATP-binding protein